jgi:hypothetical protein
MSLTLEQCQSVVKRRNAGMLSAEIAKKYDMPLYHVTLIMKCQRNRYPLNEYLLIDNPAYKFSPLHEKKCAWDLRLSLRLSRLPMSKWADAI